MAKSAKSTRCIAAGALTVLAVLLVTRALFIDYYRIPQNGMYPGHPAGSMIFVAKRAYSGPADVRRGDIVVFVRTENGTSYDYVWRIVGLPGEKVKASGDILAINGERVARERLREHDGLIIYRERVGDAAYEIATSSAPSAAPPDVSLTVPPDHFFVMGDNRSDARDSRYFGPIAFSSIVGKKL